jgi:hypothetical protein
MPFCLIEACVARSRNELWRVESRVDLFQVGEGFIGSQKQSGD